MPERLCLVHYHELGLKGKNRFRFERRLRDNLDAALASYPTERVERIAGRLVVGVTDESVIDEVADRIALVPGVARVSIAWKCGRELDEILALARIVMDDAGKFSTFRVTARRSNTDFPLGSMELARLVGGDLDDYRADARVDLTNPDLTVNVEVNQGSTYIYANFIRGIGGLPVGTDGKVVSLLSAGIDSPVATWRMMRRGAIVVGVHFSGAPFTSDASAHLVLDIGKALGSAAGLGRIYIVAFGDIQREIALLCPPDMRVILYRRMMIRVAEAIAYKEHAKALVTGESLGQVASQTLDNIRAIDQAATFPVLRPLIGSDKNEIIADAERLGTMELSIQNTDDCCTLFMPRTPETHARLDSVIAAWDELPHERMVADAMASLTWHDFPCPSYTPPKSLRTPAKQA